MVGKSGNPLGEEPECTVLERVQNGLIGFLPGISLTVGKNPRQTLRRLRKRLPVALAQLQSSVTNPPLGHGPGVKFCTQSQEESTGIYCSVKDMSKLAVERAFISHKIVL